MKQHQVNKSKSVYVDMARYLAAVSDELKGEARQAAILENPSVVGADREEVFRRFLERHLPKGCEVFRGGYVFNIQGDRSRQTDIIVASGVAPRFQMGSGGTAIAPIEGTACIVEVKSNLTTAALETSLSALADVLLIDKDSLKLNPTIKTGPQQSWDMPFKLIFAYDGASGDIVLKKLKEFYRRRLGIRQERCPSLIYVLGQYAIVRATSDIVVVESNGTTDADQPDLGDYNLFKKDIDLLAMVRILTKIQQNLILANHMLVPYDTYQSKIADVVIKGTWQP